MKKVSTKSLMVIALVVASFTATPMMVAGYDYDNWRIWNPSWGDV